MKKRIKMKLKYHCGFLVGEDAKRAIHLEICFHHGRQCWFYELQSLSQGLTLSTCFSQTFHEILEEAGRLFEFEIDEQSEEFMRKEFGYIPKIDWTKELA